MSAKAQHPLLRRAHGRGLALLVGASIAVLAVLGVVVWLVLTGGDDKTPRAAAHGMSLRQLKDFASNVGHPVY
ncbi:MAG: hypothetical protein ACJ74R_07375, partial [Gaiellaceae bacterium]